MFEILLSKCSCLQILNKSATKEYLRSFSCGILEVPQGHSKILINDIVQQSDSIMYEQKKKHKE